MPYKLRFSDLTKLETIVVPDMPPGANVSNTSLALVGKGYPNYGQKIAENFLHLLENFSGPTPPKNPIEGQLWYDTSDPDRKVLRVMDGTATSAKWPSATGIYQQPTDPKKSAVSGLKQGDIWVDTDSNQLKIYSASDWITVGPSAGGSELSGSIVKRLNDTADPPNEFYIIENWSNGEIVSIISNSAFIPNPSIEGFDIILPGINVTRKLMDGNLPIVNGTALAARSLEINRIQYTADSFLRKDDLSFRGQRITGKLYFQTSSNSILDENVGLGEDGIVINNSLNIDDQNYVQFYKGLNNAILVNNSAGGSIVLKARASDNSLKTLVVARPDTVEIQTDLTVDGITKTDRLNITSTSTTSVIIAGGISVLKDVSVEGNLTVEGDFVSNIQPVGMITAYAGNYLTVPSGWLLCDGSNFDKAVYARLFNVIGYNYSPVSSGDRFYVPNMSTSTYVTTGANTGTYIQYIIKT